eukprot:jgi/Tetstr1/420553/TSEL_011643.t1
MDRTVPGHPKAIIHGFGRFGGQRRSNATVPASKGGGSAEIWQLPRPILPEQRMLAFAPYVSRGPSRSAPGYQEAP